MLSRGSTSHLEEERALAEERMPVLDLLRKGDEPAEDPPRGMVRWAVQELLGAEVAAPIGAGRYERSGERVTRRNGTRPRTRGTRVGSPGLPIPKRRQGSHFPRRLEPRRRAERAPVAAIAEAYVRGVGTRKAGAPVRAPGISGISRREVSRLAASLDEQVAASRARRLDAEYPYPRVDARYEHVREDGRVVPMAVAVAYGARADGAREVWGLEVGLCEDVASRRESFRGLVARGRRGVRLAIGDAHPGPKRAITEVSVGAARQRCRVHVLRALLARVPERARAMAAATARTIFRQPDRTAARRRLREVCTALEEQFPRAVAPLTEAEGAILTPCDFPTEHRRRLYSTDPLERLNKELKRRSAVVGIFPNRAAVLRLSGALLREQDEEGLVGRHYFSELSMPKLLHPPPGTPAPMPPGASAS